MSNSYGVPAIEWLARELPKGQREDFELTIWHSRPGVDLKQAWENLDVGA